MLFRRKHPEQFWQKLRVALWPRRNWWRSAQYISKRVLRLSASPHVVAMGFAAGVFASFTPFIGFHFVICFAIAYIMRGNMIAAALGTWLGNPITFPFIWFYTYKLGNLLLHGNEGALTMREVSGQLLHLSFGNLIELLKPMTLGGFMLGVPMAIISYFIIRRLVFVYQRSRLAIIARRTEKRVLDKVLHRGESHGE
ncbi:DUF2062 domain-containing protein [Pararhizobium sp. IMCC21322]|uniref:DUF2062 domain-containing protein n=1 Tax=Pararhizobium sp. IMCC21322 TaxID=3067903 RepID=UPI002741AA66|nr:DUF2062 domain-containing protein [Pararhizobium sp. IMCC21322]